MDPSSLGSRQAALSQKLHVLNHQFQVLLDMSHLNRRSVKEKFDPYLSAMFVKARYCQSGSSFEEVACVVCASVPVKDWKALGTDPRKSGMHCAAHRAAFHSVCEATYNCCEPYDPDRDYEWRAPS